MSRPFTSAGDKEFGDSFIDISETHRRLVRVTTKTYPSTGTYIFLKLFKKGSDNEFYLDQRVTLSVSEFQELVNNVENISLGPQPEKKESSVGCLKRPEKWLKSEVPAKASKLSTMFASTEV